ncbi:MAG: putative quinol monooxygenase [Stellaceae bacterium]
MTWTSAPLHLLLGLMLMSGLASSAGAEEAVHVATYIEVAPASAAQAAALLTELGAASRAADGNLAAQALQEEERKNRFVFLEAWRDPAAVPAAPRLQLLGEIAALRIAPLDERVHGALSLGAPAAPPAGAVWVVTHVDVVPPRKDEAVTLLRRWAEASRGEPGNRRFDILQQSGRPNHFTVVEAWADAAALTAHLLADPTRQFRETLGPMSGALYDERLYRALD